MGRSVFLQSVASTLKCFSLQHICPKWSLIAHWRMHDIKCLQTWNNHVLSLFRACLFWHLYLPPCWTNLKFSSHILSVPLSFDHASHISVRESIYFTRTSFCVTVRFMETSCFSCAVEMQREQSWVRRRAGGFSQSPYFHLSIRPSICLSSGMNICGVAVFSHSRQFLYSFIKINFTWMSDLICCHKQFRL